LGYAEYFGIRRVVVCLGRRYAGDRVQATYAVDPRTGVELDLSVRLGFSEIEIEAIYDYKMIPDGAIHKAFANVMPPRNTHSTALSIREFSDAADPFEMNERFVYRADHTSGGAGGSGAGTIAWNGSAAVETVIAPCAVHRNNHRAL
jgi:hypothetical protein